MSASLRPAAKGDMRGSLRRPSRNLMSAQCVNQADCPAAKGDMRGSLRRPSRNLMSAQCVNQADCPASEGVPAMVALPPAPWQDAHRSALSRPASRSAACGRAGTVAASSAATIATDTGSQAAPRSTVAVSPRSALVRNVVDGPVVVVGEEHRSVGHPLDVRGATQNLATLLESVGEDLVLGRLARFQLDGHHPVADLLAAVPGAFLRDEEPVPVLRGN